MSTTITINTHEVSRRECAALIVLLNALHPSAAAEPTAPTATTGFDAQKCREAYENTYHKVAADIPFDVWEFVWKKAHGVSATNPGRYVAVTPETDWQKWYEDAMHASNEAGFSGSTAAETIHLLAVELQEARKTRDGSKMTTDDLIDTIADLNAELYSRREIKPEDNPAAGVEKAALPMLMTQHGQIVTGEAARAMDETINAYAGKSAEAMAHAGDSFAKTEVTIKAGDDLASIFGAAATDPDALASHPEITGTPEVAATTTQLDKNGLPWDSRIHAASKAINADGTWRQKRGVAPELVATVEAQLRGVMAVPVPDTHGSPELDEDAAKLEAMSGDAGPTVGQVTGYISDREWAAQSTGDREIPSQSVPPPPPPVVVLPPAPPPVLSRINDATPFGDPATFPELVAYITAQKVAGKLAQTQLDAALVAIGVQGALPVMAARPDLIPTLVAKLRVLAGG